MRQVLGLLILGGLLTFWAINVWAHGGEVHEEAAAIIEEETGKAEQVVVGVNEKPGGMLNTVGRWRNEKGESVSLDELFSIPTLLVLAYYHCPKSCNVLLADLASAVKSLDLFPDLDYRVVAVSVSLEETPKDAATAQTQYFNILGAGYPEAAWPFLVGDEGGIRRLTDSLGYLYTRKGPHSYVHPNVAIAVAPGGKIIRYIYGPGFLTAALKKGVEEATAGTPGISIRKVLTYCFDYDPKNRVYVFKTFRVMGTGIGAMAIMLLLYLVVAPTVKRPKRSV